MIDAMKWGPLKRMFYERGLRAFLRAVEDECFAVVPHRVGDLEAEADLRLAWSLGQSFHELGRGSLSIRYRWFDPVKSRYENGRGLLVLGLSIAEIRVVASEYGVHEFLYGKGKDVRVYDTLSGSATGEIEGLDIMGVDEKVEDYCRAKGLRFALNDSRGTGCKGYLGKNVHFRRDGKILIPDVRLPGAVKERLKNFKPSYVSPSVNIPERYYDLWNIDAEDLLEATQKYSGKKYEKFAYDPMTTEFLIVARGQHHKNEVVDSGSSTLDEYVRGILLRSYRGISRTVSFRPCFPREDVGQLRKEIDNEKDQKTAISLLSFDLQYSTMVTLKGLGGRRWDYQFNVDNNILEKQTGVTASEW